MRNMRNAERSHRPNSQTTKFKHFPSWQILTFMRRVKTKLAKVWGCLSPVSFGSETKTVKHSDWTSESVTNKPESVQEILSHTVAESNRPTRMKIFPRIGHNVRYNWTQSPNLTSMHHDWADINRDGYLQSPSTSYLSQDIYEQDICSQVIWS